MLKRLMLAALIAAALICSTADAVEPGDIVGKAVYTDIVAYINDQPIPSYNVGGYTVIVAEDLRSYGFDVIWDGDARTLSILKAEESIGIPGVGTVYRYDKPGVKFADVLYTDIVTYTDGEAVEAFNIDGYTMIPLRCLEKYGTVVWNQAEWRAEAELPWLPMITDPNPVENKTVCRGIIVLDPGHGKLSGAMSDEQKDFDGWQYNSDKGGWGEWRHWKSGTVWQDCQGRGCSGRAPSGGGCWYPIGNGDRDTEPEITLRNTLSAARYLEDMGYEVRMTRTDNESNPSMTKRLTYCYPNCDIDLEPDADLFVCIHSNAGGGRGSAYISLSGVYDQAGIDADYAEDSNRAGKLINDEIVSGTSLKAYSGGRYDALPELVLFCKSPIPIAYLEIGFYDNSSDRSILNSEYDGIGAAIARGVDKYFE